MVVGDRLWATYHVTRFESNISLDDNLRQNINVTVIRLLDKLNYHRHPYAEG